jgi:uncharacterized surface protein with fasciclin (FAS1) repeats
MRKKLSRSIWLVAILAVMNSGCSSPLGLLSALGTNPQLSTLLSLINTAGLGDLLKGDSPFTLLAPTNDAFKALPSDLVSSLTKPENASKLADVLKGHIIPGKLSTSQLTKAGTLNTMMDSALDVVKKDDGGLSVAGANILESTQAKNGMIYMIDKVILP